MGLGGGILHYDGSNWSIMTSGTYDSLRGVWGSLGSDVFTVGDGGTILHYSPIQLGQTLITGITIEVNGNVLAGVTITLDGRAWSALPLGSSIRYE